jgi:hypothetical protein
MLESQGERGSKGETRRKVSEQKLATKFYLNGAHKSHKVVHVIS